MNQRCYRLVFNRARGLLMAVAEITPSLGAAGSSPRLFAGTALASLLSLILPLSLLPIDADAQIISDTTAPASHQAIVSSAPNGVPLVHIQTPTAGGVSRNAFSQFDVQSNGAILNNANQSVQTALGGWVQANPLLDRPASVIVNEVNSSHSSLLHGYVEVAGQRAQVVIANPSGISCDGCGFINANRATLTTGVPQYTTNGNLDSYLVRRGTVSFNGDGLDARNVDFTDVLARAVQANAALRARQLNVIAGSNEVRASDLHTTAVIQNDDKPKFAIDVSTLGGMYAGKILLSVPKLALACVMLAYSVAALTTYVSRRRVGLKSRESSIAPGDSTLMQRRASAITAHFMRHAMRRCRSRTISTTQVGSLLQARYCRSLMQRLMSVRSTSPTPMAC